MVLATIKQDSFDPDGFGRTLESELKKYNDSHDNQFEVSASYGCVFLQIEEKMESVDKYIEIADKKMYQMKEMTDPYKR